mgnify:CR=1 FL=1
MMKKIVILGSSGFLGRNLCGFFSDNCNFELFPLSRKDVDFTNFDSLKQRVLDISPDYIIHSAVSLENFENNIRMFYALENLACYVKKIIIIGSGAEYIANRYKPLMKESYFPSEAVFPKDIYSLSKFTISKLHASSSVENIYNLRVFGIYGPHEDFQRRLISNNIVRHINNMPLTYNRNVTFDYLYINDFLSSIENFLALEKPLFNTYNLCIGKGYEFKEIMNTIADVVGFDHSKIILKDPTPSNYVYSGDSSLLENEIGKIEKTSLFEAINSLYKWYIDQDINKLKLHK